MIDRIFLHHPRSVGETYRDHAAIAWSFGAALVGAGVKCLIHAAIPAAFPTAASDRVRALYRQLERRRARAADGFSDYVI